MSTIALILAHVTWYGAIAAPVLVIVGTVGRRRG